MALYHFVTRLQVKATPDEVWDVLNDPATWPSWWRWLRQVDVLDRGDADGVGSRYRLSFRTALPYTLAFETETVQATRPSRIESVATGELAGSGLWELTPKDGATEVRYTWIVETTKRWMNLLAPLARPAFSWNHDRLMRDFASGLADQLGVQLVAVDNRTMAASDSDFGRLPSP